MKGASDRLTDSDAATGAGEDLAIAAGDSLEAVAERWPLVGQALERVGLAGSSLSVAEACRLKGWDLATTLALLETLGGLEPSRGEAAFELLEVDQICARFAEGEHQELKTRMRRVMDAVADEGGETSAAVRERAWNFKAALEQHLVSESEALATIGGGGAKLGLRALLSDLRREHEQLLELWSDMKLAFEDCNSGAQKGESQAAVRREIDALDELLERQVYLENHILFQRGSVREKAEVERGETK